jgi:hypothetical protein
MHEGRNNSRSHYIHINKHAHTRQLLGAPIIVRGVGAADITLDQTTILANGDSAFDASEGTNCACMCSSSLDCTLLVREDECIAC